MPISSNALNLAQYAILSNDPLVQAVTFSLIESGSVMADIPFVNKASLIANGVRFEGNLPTVNWSQLNAEGVTTSGTPKAYQEQAYTLRNYIDVDKLLVQDANQIVDPRAVQVDAYMRAAAYDFNGKFFNNDHIAGDPNAVVGLKYRVNNGSDFGVRPENKIDALAVDLSNTGLSAGTINQFAELIDQLLWSVDSPEGDNVALYLNDVMKRRWERGLRQFAGQGGFNRDTDQFGRTILRYKNAVIRDPGYMADQSTRIITATETAAGAPTGGTATSIYAVNYGPSHFFGWQFAPLAARDIGLMENGVIYRTMIDWAGGVMNASTRSLGRLLNVKLA